MKLHSPFKKIVNHLSEKVALTFYKDDLTFVKIDYNTLNVQLQEVLESLSIIHNDIPTTVGIYCDPGPATVVCMLAILEHNFSFFYISPNLTIPELHNLMQSVSPFALLVSSHYSDKLSNMFQSIFHSHLNILGSPFQLISFNDYKNLNSLVECKYNNSIAYVMATSGTTGMPKLVFVPHECIVPNVKDFINIFKINKNDTILGLSPLTFDPCIIDIFTSLSCGAHLIMLTPDIARRPHQLQYILKNNSVSILQATPAILETLNANFLKNEILSEKSALRVLALGGETFPSPSKLGEWIHPLTDTKLYNLYGITEVSCWASCQSIKLANYLSINEKFNCKENGSKIVGSSLGVPLTGTKMFLTDDFGNILTEGRGLITLSGARAICTIFEGNSITNANGGFIKTGDIGFQEGEDIFYVERCDNIVKRNAQKVSLLEIEITMKLHPDVVQCCAVECNKDISLYVSLKENSSINYRHLMKHLKANLVSWKTPNYIFIKDKLPININGKIDKKKLKLESKICPNDFMARDSSHSGDTILQIWKEFLTGYHPQPSDNFVLCGGTSFQAIQLAERINNTFAFNIPELLDTLLNKTYRDIHKLVYNKRSKLTSKPSMCNIFPKSMSINDVKEGHKRDQHRIISESNKLFVTGRKVTVVSKNGYHCGDSALTQVDNFKLSINWKFCLEKCIDSSPLIVQTDKSVALYIGSHSHKFVSLDAESGNEIWSINLPNRIEASASVSLDRQSIYVGCYDGFLYCLDIQYGKTLWKFATRGLVKCTPVVHEESGYLIFGSYDKHLYCLNSNGTEVWRKRYSKGSICSSPAIYRWNIYSASLDGYLVCLNICNGKIEWKEFIGKPIFSALTVFSDGILFGCADNNIYCYTMDGIYMWKYQTGGPVFSSPFLIENALFTVIAVGSHDNHVYFLSKSGVELATYKLSSPVFGTPYLVMKSEEEIYAIINETVGEMHICKLSLKNNLLEVKKESSIKFDGELFSTPVFYNERIYVGCRDNFVYSIHT